MADTASPALGNIISEKPEDPFIELTHGAWCGIDLEPFLQDDAFNIDHDGEELAEPRTWWYVKDCTQCACSPMTFPRQAGAWSYISHVRCRIRFAVHLVNAHRMSTSDALNEAFDRTVDVVADIETPEEQEQKSPEQRKPQPKARPKTSIHQDVHDASLEIVMLGQAQREFDPYRLWQLLDWVQQRTYEILQDVNSSVRPLQEIDRCMDLMHQEIKWHQLRTETQFVFHERRDHRDENYQRRRSRSNRQDSKGNTASYMAI